MAPTAVARSPVDTESNELDIPKTLKITEIDASLNHIKFTDTLKFYLNGRLQILKNPNPEGALIDYIRSQPNLTATKMPCGEGGCGACSVVQANFIKGELVFKTVNSCLVPLISIDGSYLITTEGIGSVKNPHPIQERIAKFHGSQCGFCTPGIVMSLYGLLRTHNGHVSKHQISEALDGNLCRCTGYMPILDAAFTFAYDSDNYNKTKKLEIESLMKLTEKPNSTKNGVGCGKADCCQLRKTEEVPDDIIDEVTVPTLCSKGDSCCKAKPHGENGDSCSSNGNGSSNGHGKSCGKNGDGSSSCNGNGNATTTEYPDTEIDMNLLFTPNGLPLKPYDPAEDLVVPEDLASFNKAPIFYGNDYKIWFRPTTKLQLLEILKVYPESKIVSGASEVQIEVRIKASDYKRSIFVNHIEELQTVEYIEGKGLLVGGNLPLTDLENFCEDLTEKLPRHRAQVFKVVAQQLKYFAGRQVRNVATPAGNIVTASPIADLNPILVACNATIFATRLGDNGQLEDFEVPMTDFFTGYRRHKLPPGCIITNVLIPETLDKEYIQCFKQSKRKDDDISIVTACLRIKLDDQDNIESSSLIYGGMAPMTVHSPKTEEYLIGKSIHDESVIEKAIDFLSEDFPLKFNVPGGMATYRRTLTFSFFYKFINYILNDLDKNEIDSTVLAEVTRNHPAGFRELVQPFQENIVGSSVPHVNSLKQATGEAEYVEDVRPFREELFGAQVLSTKAHAKVLSVDWSAIHSVATVVGYIDINDLPHKQANYWGAVPFGKEEFFADKDVRFVGQTIGVVFASNQERANEAARLVKVEYEELPKIITCEDAVEQGSFFEEATRIIEKGDFDSNFATAKYKFENTTRMGAQEHFYFEPQNCLVIPEEDGELKIISSTQNPKETQEFAALVTDVPMHKIVAKVKRLGGGFGGKETRSVQLSSLACIAANKFRKPIRIVLSRYDDMLTSGQRHPFYMRWKCGMDENYKIVAFRAELYANGGWSMDLSQGVLDRAVLHAQNCYNIENCYIIGKVCKTNIASNTAFRGFGGPQGMFVAESMMVDISERLNVDVELLRDRNYHDPNSDQTTPYQQKVCPDYTTVDLVKQNKETAQFDKIKKSVEDFNKTSKWIKRGYAQVPTMFGVSFGVKFLNQAGALIHIYHDGSVLVSHGGVEIGQGLNTKMIMIVCEELGVPIEKVFISETSTQAVPNTSATAASAASDLNGAACKNACDKLNERIAPMKEKHPDVTWEELIHHCYFDRISLSATGFYKTPDIGYIFGAKDPLPPFFYFTQGSAICEVELDTLTGDWSVLKTFIKMDIGRPINQAIDYGQIEGAFIQGMGLYTIEQSLWFNATGALATRGPGNYKIPGFKDIPQVFHISMLNDRKFEHLKTIKKSKGIGEPPLFLGCAVHFALRNAINSARKEHTPAAAATKHAQMPFISPLTTERIRNHIGDFLTEKAKVEAEGNEFFIEA